MSSPDQTPDVTPDAEPPLEAAAAREKGANEDLNPSQSVHFSPVTLVVLLLLLLVVGCAGGVGFAWGISRWNIGIAGQLLYYMLLLVWGLICAIVLFAGLNSYARVSGKHLGWTIELGGPAALFAAVVVGGFYFVPKQQDVNFAVWVRLPNHNYANTGSLTMNINQSQPQIAPIASNGQAMFGDISTGRITQIQNGNVEFIPSVPGFPETPKVVDYLRDKQRYELKLDSFSTKISGNIVRVKGENGSAELRIEHLMTLPVGSDNTFHGTVQAKEGSSYLVEVCINGEQAYLEPIPLGSGMPPIKLHRPTGYCRISTGN